MFCGLESDVWGWRGNEFLPPVQRLVACGYDPHCYISTAQLAIFPYTTQAAITARFGGQDDVISSTDDQNTGQINQTIFNSTVLNVTREINGFISTIYPIPLAQTGTVAILVVDTLTTDGKNGVATFTVAVAGNYSAKPSTAQSPVYMRYLDPIANAEWQAWSGQAGFGWQTGSGLQLTVAYATTQVTQGDGTTIPAYSVSGTPTIGAAGTNYNVGDILVLVGGSSFVPDKISNAASALVCYELMRRRLSPNEVNNFWDDAKAIKSELLKIGNGELDLDGTYRRFYSPVASQNSQSMLRGNSA